MYLKKLVTLACFIIIGHSSKAQESGFNIDIKSHSENRETRELYKFLKIERHEVKLHGADVAGKKANISYVEYIDGKASKEHTLTRGLPDNYYAASEGDTMFEFSLLTQEKDTALRIQFGFPRFSMDLDYDRLGERGYSMRYINYNKGECKYNDKMALFTWALPYEGKKEGDIARWSYCDLTRKGVPPEQWYEEYGVKHYIIFYLKVID